MTENAIQTSNTQVAPVDQNAAAMLSIIEGAVKNPEVDVEKMRALLDMQERIFAKNAEIAFNQAMARLQPILPVIRHDKSIQHNNKLISKYASYEAIDEQIRPLYTSEGFSLSFNSKKHEDGTVTYYGTLSHRDGHSRTAEMDLPSDASGAKNAIQAKGSTISYAKRYLITMLLNLVTSGEDDDGKAGGAQPITEAQVKEIEELAEQVGADLPAFLKYMGADEVASIPSRDYGKALNALNAKKNAKARAA
jgi:hypothetical protein